MGTEQKQIHEQLSELQGKVKHIHANQEKFRKAGDGDEAEAESSTVRDSELWVKELKDKVGVTV